MAVVEIETHGQILMVRMNRPERLNALNHEMRLELARIWSAFRTDPALEVAILTGTGRGFCAGEDMKESLADKVNLADQSYVAAGGPPGLAAWWPEFKDGYPVHAPVGRFAANAYGLHEVCGNVWEWCFDAYADYPSEETRDPRLDGDGLAPRVSRGGSFNNAATLARSACRDYTTPAYRLNILGVRPSRALRLSTSPPHNGR